MTAGSRICWESNTKILSHGGKTKTPTMLMTLVLKQFSLAPTEGIKKNYPKKMWCFIILGVCKFFVMSCPKLKNLIRGIWSVHKNNLKCSEIKFMWSEGKMCGEKSSVAPVATKPFGYSYANVGFLINVLNK